MEAMDFDVVTDSYTCLESRVQQLRGVLFLAQQRFDEEKGRLEEMYNFALSVIETTRLDPDRDVQLIFGDSELHLVSSHISNQTITLSRRRLLERCHRYADHYKFDCDDLKEHVLHHIAHFLVPPEHYNIHSLDWLAGMRAIGGRLSRTCHAVRL